MTQDKIYFILFYLGGALKKVVLLNTIGKLKETRTNHWHFFGQLIIQIIVEQNSILRGYAHLFLNTLGEKENK